MKILLERKRKESVRIISEARYRQLHRRELRLMRAYLARLPYECRTLYFKYLQVKKSNAALIK